MLKIYILLLLQTPKTLKQKKRGKPKQNRFIVQTEKANMAREQAEQIWPRAPPS